MSITYDKSQKRFIFHFDRIIQSSRIRVKRNLPEEFKKKDAEKFDREESARLIEEHSRTRSADPLVSAAVLLYLKDKKHLKSYESAKEHLSAVHPMFGGKRMSDLPDISRAINDHPAWKPATKKNRLALLRAACRWAWKRHQLTEHDPTHVLIMPQVRNARTVYLSRSQMVTLAQQARKRGMFDLSRVIRIAFYSGMRLGEILSANINGDGDFELRDTKNGDSRIVPVHPRIRRAVQWLPIGGSRSAIESQWRKVRADVGLAHVHFHDLRHSTASEMINNGVSLNEVGAVLGHRDPKSTMRYAHLQKKTLASAIAQVGSKKGR